ncbi:MAG: phosphate ABC transporter substrate-binding protein [Planctomycetaceae bacterium]|nr:phosphate ABC transporter substrate-binding protein [Planctomycetaceae bacterium]
MGGARRHPEGGQVVSCAALAMGLVAVFLAGCGGYLSQADGTPRVMIRVEGSDTMVNIAQAWAEEYHRQQPGVVVQVLGGGSGVGIASLIDGNCDMANSSRQMKPEEIADTQSSRGSRAVEHVVGFDAMGIYVHPTNPITGISIPELAAIFVEHPAITRWSQLGVTMPVGVPDTIIRVSRQNSSGTYSYFREHVLGKGYDMGLGSLDANGSKDAVALVSRTPCAIGYSGMGYATPGVKMVPVARQVGQPWIEPSVENAKSGAYPITRPLLIYTVGDPVGAVGAYMQWIMAEDGQEIVRQLGYVPVK